MRNILEIKNVSKKYEGFRIDNINLSVPKGCIMGLIGENGAGKTSIIKMIFDIVKRDSGDILLFGESADGNKLARDRIGVVMESSNFSEALRAKDINSILKRIYKNWKESTYTNYLERFSIPPNKMIKDLSRGMKMKLSIAAALSHGAELLVLDEATSGLDPIVRDEILDIFLEFIQNEENAVLISSHITSDLEKICDRIAFIHQGTLIFNQEKDELLDSHGLLRCSEDEFESFKKTGDNEKAIVGSRQNKYGVDALLHRPSVQGSYEMERPVLEEIMLFYYKK